jgi:2-amino-4-hydroxy-6-hydroxymethyldihydropteridine diphosphokinase
VTASPVIAYIGIGSNLGAAQDNVQRAIRCLQQLPDSKLGEVSSLFRTTPVDADGDDYINAVAQLETRLPPTQLLEHLQAIESEFGRERPYRNAPRTLDLDILLYGRQELDSVSLTVPHPRLTERAFALIPLLQIDPLIAIPGKGPAHAFVPAVAGQAIQKI